MRILFADLAKARRDLIESKALDDAPFLTRLWYHHLFWLCSFIKSSTGIYAKRLIRITTELYCKSADHIFGGTRYERRFTKPSPIPISWQRPTPTKTANPRSFVTLVLFAVSRTYSFLRPPNPGTLSG